MSAMTVRDALDFFEQSCLIGIAATQDLPRRLIEAGFSETARAPIGSRDGAGFWRALYRRAGSAYGISLLIDETGAVTDPALLLPETDETIAALQGFVDRQPNLIETTQDMRPFLASAPEAARLALAASRFWTSKARGATGVNLTLGPALIELDQGIGTIALTLGCNPALADPLDAATLAELTGDGSRLAKFIGIFIRIATRAGSDLEKLATEARALGYDGEISAGSREEFQLHGGHGPRPRSEDRTSSIQVNCNSGHAFEFALTFILDDRLSAGVIADALFSRLGITPDPGAGEGATLILDGQPHRVRHLIESAAFGNHAFVLHR